MKKREEEVQGQVKMSLLERYLAVEIGIEFKACLYFFCILFFYSMYRLLCGSMEASILHMGEMIFLTYGMGYIQKYILDNFGGDSGRSVSYCSVWESIRRSPIGEDGLTDAFLPQRSMHLL